MLSTSSQQAQVKTPYVHKITCIFMMTEKTNVK